MSRVCYIIKILCFDIVSTLSRLFNALFLSGSTAQTTSSHCYVNPNLHNLRSVVNTLFFWQEDHCKEAWEEEVKRAVHTLETNGAITIEEYNVV